MEVCWIGVGWGWVQLSHRTETAGVPAGDSGRPQAGEPLEGGNLGLPPSQRVSDIESRSLVMCGRAARRGPRWLGLQEGGGEDSWWVGSGRAGLTQSGPRPLLLARSRSPWARSF